MPTLTKALYDTDFLEWSAQTAELLREGKFDELDLQHVAEEIEDLGKSDFRAARSQLERLLRHLIKQKIQPERDGASWRGSITQARQELHLLLEDSPSLRGRLESYLSSAYTAATRNALLETGKVGQHLNIAIPMECPFTLTQLLDADSLEFCTL